MDWGGISLEVLARLLGEVEAKSATLIFALYSLKEILRVERGRVAHYRLGIKEFASHLQQRWGDELVQVHQSLAKTFHNDWQGRYEELETTDAGTGYRLRHLLAHTELSADEGLKQAVWGDKALADAYIGQGIQADEERSDFAAAVAWHYTSYDGFLILSAGQLSKPLLFVLVSTIQLILVFALFSMIEVNYLLLRLLWFFIYIVVMFVSVFFSYSFYYGFIRAEGFAEQNAMSQARHIANTFQGFENAFNNIHSTVIEK